MDISTLKPIHGKAKRFYALKAQYLEEEETRMYCAVANNLEKTEYFRKMAEATLVELKKVSKDQ